MLLNDTMKIHLWQTWCKKNVLQTPTPPKEVTPLIPPAAKEVTPLIPPATQPPSPPPKVLIHWCKDSQLLTGVSAKQANNLASLFVLPWDIGKFCKAVSKYVQINCANSYCTVRLHY